MAQPLTLPLVTYNPTSTLATHQGIERHPSADATGFNTVILSKACRPEPLTLLRMPQHLTLTPCDLRPHKYLETHQVIGRHTLDWHHCGSTTVA